MEAVISAADVKRLRTSTGAGMMDCKKALSENGGDFDKATEVGPPGGTAFGGGWGGRVGRWGEGLAGLYKRVVRRCARAWAGLAAAATRTLRRPPLPPGSIPASPLAPPCPQWLRQKGLSGADKKAGRIATEGAVARYIHPGSRLGVLLEVNCETDFVGAGDAFTSLVNGLAMQIAASPALEYVSSDEIPPEVFARELEVEMGREDLQSKVGGGGRGGLVGACQQCWRWRPGGQPGGSKASPQRAAPHPLPTRLATRAPAKTLPRRV